MSETILNTAERMLTTRGVHYFTMDDLAQELGISKKTLYRFFTSKQSLIQQVCKRITDRLEQSMRNTRPGSSDQLEILLAYLGVILSFIKSVNPEFFADLRKYFPELWRSSNAQIFETVAPRIQKVLEDGILTGTFRGNLHPALIVNLWQQHMHRDYEYAASLVNDFSKDEVFRQAINLFLYGVISPAATGQLEQALQEQSLKTHPGFKNS